MISFFKGKEKSRDIKKSRDILAELERERAHMLGTPTPTTPEAASKTQQAMMNFLEAERNIALRNHPGYGGGGQLIFELGMIGIAATFAVVMAKPTDNGRWHRNRGRTAWG